MKTRVIIEYDLPAGDHVVVRDREEQRWITSETVLALPGSPTACGLYCNMTGKPSSSCVPLAARPQRSLPG
jgi:hypothetical protein